MCVCEYADVIGLSVGCLWMKYGLWVMEVLGQYGQYMGYGGMYRWLEIRGKEREGVGIKNVQVVCSEYGCV